VTLLPRPEPGADIHAPVINGTADFGVDTGAGLVMARSQGLPVTVIATIYRRYPLVFITLASRGITRPHGAHPDSRIKRHRLPGYDDPAGAGPRQRPRS
jgi:ABC-type nitrate/sulfonate/bicarbonate transport system substrate-binding protein